MLITTRLFSVRKDENKPDSNTTHNLLAMEFLTHKHLLSSEAHCLVENSDQCEHRHYCCSRSAPKSVNSAAKRGTERKPECETDDVDDYVRQIRNRDREATMGSALIQSAFVVVLPKQDTRTTL